ncbi:hypothetical protein OSB04_003536 [Centaurea solstitialis]|uniref:Uncharacterized protein n=1 Tax=Centaurea solstitialis TaxID=347529 RepID=A0AA38TV24_9ASTR|nr:hypothetical protein OSB04_003536 [Centaurea solstitialis]
MPLWSKTISKSMGRENQASDKKQGYKQAQSNHTLFFNTQRKHNKHRSFAEKYILDLHKEHGIRGYKPIATLVELRGTYKQSTKEETTAKRMYQQLVGKQIYLSQTRHDIVFVVSLVGR